MKPLPPTELRAELDAAPDWALFSEDYVVAARGVSVFTVRQERQGGRGVPFVRQGRRILYRKGDIIAFLQGLPSGGPPRATPAVEVAA
jgi:hypothetical protein